MEQQLQKLTQAILARGELLKQLQLQCAAIQASVEEMKPIRPEVKTETKSATPVVSDPLLRADVPHPLTIGQRLGPSGRRDEVTPLVDIKADVQLLVSPIQDPPQSATQPAQASSSRLLTTGELDNLMPARCSMMCSGDDTASQKSALMPDAALGSPPTAALLDVAITNPAPSLGAPRVCADTCIIAVHQLFGEMPPRADVDHAVAEVTPCTDYALVNNHPSRSLLSVDAAEGSSWNPWHDQLMHQSSGGVVVVLQPWPPPTQEHLNRFNRFDERDQHQVIMRMLEVSGTQGRSSSRQVGSRLAWSKCYAAKDIQFGVEARALMLRGVEEWDYENRHLRQLLAKEGDLQFMQLQYTDEACKLSVVQRQLKELSGGIDLEENNHSDPWVSALISKSEHFKVGKFAVAKRIFYSMKLKDVVSWNTILSGHVESGCLDNAAEVFKEMPCKNELSGMVMVSGFVHGGLAEDALKLFNQMRAEDVKPCDYTYAGAIAACGELGALKHGKQLHAHLVQCGFEASNYAGNALLTMYAKCGAVKDARLVFLVMPNVDSVSWNAMISALGQRGHGREALELFDQMVAKGIYPDLLQLNIRKKWAEYFKEHAIFWTAKSATATLEGKTLSGYSEENCASLDLDIKEYGRDELLRRLQAEAESIVAQRRTSTTKKDHEASSSDSVPSSKCYFSIACSLQHRYKLNKSSTYKKNGETCTITYGSGSNAGFFREDSVLVGDLVVKNQKFIVTYPSQPVLINNPIHRWNPSLPDSTSVQVPNEDVERKFQHLASSVHKMGMVLDSVQSDVMQLNRAMKEASLDSGSIRQKVVLLENSLQQILKGQDDLKALLEGSTKGNPDQLSVLNSHTSKLNEISSTLSVWPKQVQADLRQLQGDIFRIFTKEMEGIVRAIRSLNSRPATMQMMASCTTNERPLMNQTPVTKFLPAPLVCPAKVADPKPKVDQGKVKSAPQKLVELQTAMEKTAILILYGLPRLSTVSSPQECEENLGSIWSSRQMTWVVDLRCLCGLEQQKHGGDCVQARLGMEVFLVPWDPRALSSFARHFLLRLEGKPNLKGGRMS